MTRTQQLCGLTIPPEVTVHGTLDRAAYLEMLSNAMVVVVPTRQLSYPTGQTVLLEAMALGKACVVTSTPAIMDYVEDGVDALTVAPFDAEALAEAISRLLLDDALRARLGAAAQERVRATATTSTMWASIDELLTTRLSLPTARREASR